MESGKPGGEAPTGWVDAFRERIASWVVHAFGDAALTDRWERTARVVEEALELAQAEGLDHEDVYRIWERVYSRGKGSVPQEAAGLMVCFLAWAAGTGTDLRAVTLTEIERIERPEVTTRIRAKQAEKAAAGTGKGYPFASAEPRAAPPALPAELSGKGKQPALCGDWNPNKYEGVGPLRCGRLPGHKPPHTAFIPDFSYETRRTVNWGGPDEGAAKEQPEPGEAKKEEGT